MSIESWLLLVGAIGGPTSAIAGIIWHAGRTAQSLKNVVDEVKGLRLELRDVRTELKDLAGDVHSANKDISFIMGRLKLPNHNE